MPGKTITEKILSAHSRHDARAGDIVICEVDALIGTDASSPMTFDYFKRMGGERLFDPDRVILAMDHYSPATSDRTQAFHAEMRDFASVYGANLYDEGVGISFQLAMEKGRVVPGDLVIGADSHTVTCGALNLFATGVGSSDLAAAMITGQVWLRVPETIRVVLTGTRPIGVTAKDIALWWLAQLGAEGANYQTLEFAGPGLEALSIEDRMVLSNLAVETGAKAAIFPADDTTHDYLASRTTRDFHPVSADQDAHYAREIIVELEALTPRIALPHAPDRVASLAAAAGTPVNMVFIGTCNGGRFPDFAEALAVIERAGGRIAPGVQLVLTPASLEVAARLSQEGLLQRFEAIGAIITLPGCGACCGTSGVIPTDNMTVLSTANRNFKARMGNVTASIYLASPAACAAAAVTGHITDPRTIAGDN